MKKILTIGWKDLVTIFHDRTALLLMLGAPFVLTLGLGLVTGAFSGSDGGVGLADIPVVVVNADEGELGAALVDVLTAADLADLLAPQTAVSAPAARQQVAADAAAAAVIIPAGFSAGLIPTATGESATADAAAVEVYANPARPISAGVVESIVGDFVSRVETGVVATEVTVQQMAASGRIAAGDPNDMARVGRDLGEQFLAQMEHSDAQAITVSTTTAVAADDFNLLAFIAPGMAVLFLMYTVTYGSRTILAERDEGTLARLLVSPTPLAQVLGGKVIGIFLSGVAQVGVLILATGLLFGVRWGDPLAVALIIITVSAAATGWGLLLAAVAQTPSQLSSVGSAMMLTFGILGGSFVQFSDESIVALLGKITPNAWAIDGFITLGSGGSLADVAPALLALVVMAALLFATAVAVFQRRATTIVHG